MGGDTLFSHCAFATGVAPTDPGLSFLDHEYNVFDQGGQLVMNGVDLHYHYLKKGACCDARCEARLRALTTLHMRRRALQGARRGEGGRCGGCVGFAVDLCPVGGLAILALGAIRPGCGCINNVLPQYAPPSLASSPQEPAVLYTMKDGGAAEGHVPGHAGGGGGGGRAQHRNPRWGQPQGLPLGGLLRRRPLFGSVYQEKPTSLT